MLFLDASDCRDACAQERNFLAMFRLSMLFALLSLSFGLHTRLAQFTAHAHAHDIALAVLLMVSSILMIGVAARLFFDNINRIARKQGFGYNNDILR
ncbi:hypothetical protein EXIGLDRAFT_769758 [Exidia glandulosa HHB12029]|uniref:DUF202 domain-containing protein n=1 Tax=Exidia glandulosa HHB12029 TaxID=1314781 RepID=A0A165H8N7_EXIGL|nr:hypothetical protein EXIGLDRAFT_769758 [Exidia glandulosa HHB12029]